MAKLIGFALVELDPTRIRMDFYDVLNTKEKARVVTPPTAEDIVLAYSWCGTREGIGRPDLSLEGCP